MSSSEGAIARAVPEFEETPFREKSSDFCVLVFVIDEHGKLEKQLSKMREYTCTVDVAVADGGSTDGSTRRDVIEPLGVNTLLVKVGPGKLGAQMRMGFAWALDRGYKGVITMDGNNKDGPEAIPAFLELLRRGVDHVQGSRFMPGGVSENMPLTRWLGVRLVHAPLISAASGLRLTDTTNGFRAYSAELLRDPKMAIFREVFAGYELHYYMSIRAARLGYRIVETPVSRRYPSAGPVPTKISPLRGNLSVLRCLFNACLGRYDPDRRR